MQPHASAELQDLGRVGGSSSISAAAPLVEVLFGKRPPSFDPKPPKWTAINQGVTLRTLCIPARIMGAVSVHWHACIHAYSRLTPTHPPLGPPSPVVCPLCLDCQRRFRCVTEQGGDSCAGCKRSRPHSRPSRHWKDHRSGGVHLPGAVLPVIHCHL